MTIETAKPKAGNNRIANLGKNAKTFQPGTSGNPSGRPKSHKTVTEIANENSERAMKRLAQLIDSPDERTALAAANAILDRAVGKPKQSIEKTTKKEPADYDSAELLAIARMGSTRVDPAQHGQDEPNCVQQIHIPAIPASRAPSTYS